MKLIIPMAGLGKRMRPHTLSTPKPLLKVAGQSIVERIISGFSENSGRKVLEIHFIIAHFGREVEEELLRIAETHGAKAYFHYQEEALGTAHAVFCAKSALEGEVCVAFADTLYIGSFNILDSDTALIWTLEVPDPSHYGVVVSNQSGEISDFVEKPINHVSNSAIVGLYYFKQGERLRDSILNLINSNRKVNGEFQLTEALKDLTTDGFVFEERKLEEWLDFGNVPNFIKSMEKYLTIEKTSVPKFKPGVKIIPPVWIGEKVTISNSTIGPFVVVDDGSTIQNSNLKKCIVGENADITNSKLYNSLIGNNVRLNQIEGKLNLGDFNEISGTANIDIS